MNDDDALYHRLADCLDSVLAEATVARAGDEHSPGFAALAAGERCRLAQGQGPQLTVATIFFPSKREHSHEFECTLGQV